MLHGLEVDQFSRAALPLERTALAQLDLGIHAAVVAMGFHRLGDLQEGDGQKAAAADGGQYGVGVGAHHLASGELLLGVIAHGGLDAALMMPR